jgi:regulatory protein YycH of two-component signal transduction system YycFG
MELDIEIFDKNGKVLHIGSIISRFLFNQAEKNNKDVEDLVIGIQLSKPIRNDGKNIIQLMDCAFCLIDDVLCDNYL